MSDILENPLRKCLTCLVNKICQFSKFHSSPAKGDTTKKRRKYTDETGRLWHGTKCPDCAAEWRKGRINAVESAKQQELKRLLEEKN